MAGAAGCRDSPVNSRWISCRVSGISWSSPWQASPGWAAARTDKNAQASSARMVHRCQVVQLRTLVLVQGGQFLAASEPVLSPRSGHPHKLGQGHWVRSVGAVERILAVADPVTDQQPMRTAALGNRRFGGIDKGPVIPAGPLGARAGRYPLPDR
jgi:hypothetical protein